MDRVAALREIEALLRRHTGAEEEARILSLLRSRTDADLDALLMSLAWRRVFRFIPRCARPCSSASATLPRSREARCLTGVISAQ